MTPGIGSWIILSSALFSIGLVGVLLRRNPLVILLSIEIMLNAGNLLLVAGSRYVGGNDGQVFALTDCLVRTRGDVRGGICRCHGHLSYSPLCEKGIHGILDARLLIEFCLSGRPLSCIGVRVGNRSSTRD